MRLYSVTDDDDECVLVIANNAKEARGVGLAELDCEFIDIRVRWIKNADVKNIEAGLYKDDYKALKNGWYSCIYDDCPICGKNEVTIIYDEDKEMFQCCSCKQYFKEV